jgi:DNA invertase Pin-like site-specific DNA recombinase
MAQVRTNLESQRRQYALVDRGQALGFSDVEVIDDDLGRSGAGTEFRPGFARLVAMVCEGIVGAVLVIEASRIARNGRDWHHLIDLCSLAETLIIDHDGVYDGRVLNDRLMLGLKGTMAEFELGLLRQRSREAIEQMIGRGELLWRPPVGYVRTPTNGLELTPDLQVQQAVGVVFSKFEELGSARQVSLWHQQEGLLLPRTVKGTRGMEVAWRKASGTHIAEMLRNPFYAGTFVWPRRRSRTIVVDGRARRVQGAIQSPEQWQVVLHGHHSGYISWDQYERNQRLLSENATMHGRDRTRGAARTGKALLPGLLHCARCGRRLSVQYSRCGKETTHRYECTHADGETASDKTLAFAGARVDDAVGSMILEALSEEGIAASLAAAERLSHGHEQKIRALELAVEKAEYDVQLARRRYDSVDPANRLVALELERRWNEALERDGKAKARLADARLVQPPLSASERERLMLLGSDLRNAWEHVHAPVTLKKRIVRTVLEQIVVDIDYAAARIVLKLHWMGGVHTTLFVKKNRVGRTKRSTDRNVIELLRSLAQICDDKTIARVLNINGCRTGHDNSWTQANVCSARNRYRIPCFDTTHPRCWVTLHEAAHELNVGVSIVRRLLRDGVISGDQILHGAPWRIERAELQRPEVKTAIQKRSLSRPGQEQLPL